MYTLSHLGFPTGPARIYFLLHLFRTLRFSFRSTHGHSVELVLSSGDRKQHISIKAPITGHVELTDDTRARSPPDARGQQEEKKRRGVVQSHLLEIQRK